MTAITDTQARRLTVAGARVRELRQARRLAVDGQHVHKVNPDNILVRELHDHGSHAVVSAHLPDDRLVTAVEMFRQAGTAALHLFAGVPLVDRQVLSSVKVHRHPAATGDTEVKVFVERRGRAYTVRCETPSAFAEVVGTSMEPRVYQRMFRPTEPDMPAAISLGGVAIDTGDPLLFDHPYDHVPGVALISAATRIHGEVSCAEFSFVKYAPINEPLEYRASDFIDGNGETVASALLFTHRSSHQH